MADPTTDAGRPLTPEQYQALYAQVQVLQDRQQQDRQDLALLRREGAPRADIMRLERQVERTATDLQTLRERFAAMSTPPPQDPLSALWSAILSGVVAPFKAYASAQWFTQIFVIIVALFALLVLTDGGREIIGGLLDNTGEAIERAGEDLKGDSVEVVE